MPKFPRGLVWRGQAVQKASVFAALCLGVAKNDVFLRWPLRKRCVFLHFAQWGCENLAFCSIGEARKGNCSKRKGFRSAATSGSPKATDFRVFNSLQRSTALVVGTVRAFDKSERQLKAKLDHSSGAGTSCGQQHRICAPARGRVGGNLGFHTARRRLEQSCSWRRRQLKLPSHPRATQCLFY